MKDAERQWLEFTNPGSIPDRQSIEWDATTQNVLQPDQSASLYPNYRPATVNHDIPSFDMTSYKLSNPVFSFECYVPKRGKAWLFVDVEFWMQYWQENTAPFVYNEPWVLSFSPSNYVQVIGEWSIFRAVQDNYHAQMVGKLLLNFVKATNIDFTVAIRCGTATPKGQVMFASARCEVAVSTAKYRAITDSALFEDEVCAANDESGEVEDLDNPTIEPFVLVS